MPGRRKVDMKHDQIEKFFEDLHTDMLAGKFQKPTPEEERGIDALFAFMKPHFDRALEDLVRRGVLVKREDGE